MSGRRSHDRIRPKQPVDGARPWRPSVPLSKYLDILLMPREGPQSSLNPIADSPKDIDEFGAMAQGADSHGGEPAPTAPPNAVAGPVPDPRSTVVERAFIE